MKWNIAEDITPGNDREVLVTDGDNYYIAHYTDYENEWYSDNFENLDITHWMDLPPQPED